jgi:hypothetical protein
MILKSTALLHFRNGLGRRSDSYGIIRGRFVFNAAPAFAMRPVDTDPGRRDDKAGGRS